MAEEAENQDTKTILTPDEYQNRLVDFYSQTLGATGIDVDDDDDKDDDKDDTYVAPSIIPDQSSDGGQSIAADVLDFQYDIDSVVNTDLPRSYEDHLSSIGREDKSDLSKFGIKSIEPPSKEQLQRYGATKGLGAVFGITGLVAEIGASMVGGKSQKNMFGVEEFKPTGIPGVVQDFSESMRLDAYNKNKEAYTKVKANYEAGLGPVGTVGSFEDYARTQDYGFSANSKNAGSAIYREVGSRIYNGAGMIGIDQETARRIEALKLGYRPIGFDPTDPSKSESLVSTGTGKKSLSGYDELGYHHSVKFGSAGMGRMKDVEQLAEEWGLGVDETRNILADVRSRRSFIGRDIKGKNLTQMLTDARNRKQQQQQQQQQQSDDSDDVKDDQVDAQTYTTTTAQLSTTAPTTAGFFTDDDSDDNNDGGGSSPSDGGGDFGLGDPAGIDFATGGRVGMQEGDVVVKEPGFIAPDPNATKQQEIADDKPMDARQGDFIINAPAAEEAGKQDIQRMINTAITNLQEKGVDVRFGDPKINIADKVKLLVSRNEVYIPAIIAKEIGYDRLKKINNRGKREVQRRQEESQQDEKPQARGFIQKKKGDVVEDRGFVTAPVTRDTATFTVFKNFLKKRKPLRADIENFIDTIPGDKGRLGVLAGTEAPLETSTLPELEAIIQTILNRVNDRTFEFRNINSVKDIMKQRSSRGTGSKMFMYDGLERKFLRPRIKEIVKNPKVFQAGLDAAENVLTKGGGEPDYEMEMLPPNVFNYAKVGDASKRMSKNPKLKFYKRVGQHDFYERIP